MTMESRYASRRCIIILALLVLLPAACGWAVTSKITRQSSSKDLLQGETDLYRCRRWPVR